MKPLKVGDLVTWRKSAPIRLRVPQLENRVCMVIETYHQAVKVVSPAMNGKVYTTIRSNLKIVSS